MEIIAVLLILAVYFGLEMIFSIVRTLTPSEKRQNKMLERIKKMIEEDNKSREFNRQNYGEAFADNFARMYGYGPQLMSGLNKLSKSLDIRINSWTKREEKRERYIFNMTLNIINDEHKSDIHRIASLIKEYQADIDDPNTPPEVKKMLESDLKELKLVLNKYMNEMSDFQNKVNKAIAGSLNILSDDEPEESEEPPLEQQSQAQT